MADHHAHNLTLLTTRNPTKPAAYTHLRRALVRTLSAENLPRHTSSGPIFFGSPTAGYTTAYVFRLPDPRARGHRRTYALLAISAPDLEFVSSSNTGSGHATANAWRAMLPISRVFAGIATWMSALASARLEADLNREHAQSSDEKLVRGLTPVSSFLTTKTLDPDGYPRSGSGAATGIGRGGTEASRAKNLVEIAGRDGLFVELHVRFVGLLLQLAQEFGT